MITRKEVFEVKNYNGPGQLYFEDLESAEAYLACEALFILRNLAAEADLKTPQARAKAAFKAVAMAPEEGLRALKVLIDKELKKPREEGA